MYDAASGSSPAGGRMYFGSGDDAVAASSVIASATKQSRLPPRKDSGLLRCARNDVGENLRKLRLHNAEPVQLHPHLVAGFQPQRLHQASGQHELSRVNIL